MPSHLAVSLAKRAVWSPTRAVFSPFCYQYLRLRERSTASVFEAPKRAACRQPSGGSRRPALESVDDR